MDFTLPPETEDLRLRVRAFVEEHVLPLEADPENFSEHENIPEARLAKVREKAKKAGLWAPQSPKEFGGMDLPIVAWAAIYEEAARSIFGALALNCMPRNPPPIAAAASTLAKAMIAITRMISSSVKPRALDLPVTTQPATSARPA